MPDYNLVVIGGGIAGMTAAIGAAREGIKRILIIEKEHNVGGIINQCIHNGFGEESLGKMVTGPEYIDFIEKQLKEFDIKILLNTTVLDVTREKVVTFVNAEEGVKDISAGVIIFAMGAKEKYSGNFIIPTNGLTGIFTVGEAHRIINLEGYLPGKRTVIIAKDKWGFLVARRLIIEGGSVEGIIIEKPSKDVINEEVQDILDGFNIPIIENSRVIEVEGRTRIEKVKIINLINEAEEEKECDSLLLSVNFSPEDTLIKKLNISFSSNVFNPKLIDFKTSLDGFYVCGNIIYGENAFHMKEVDGIQCGIQAAEYIKKYIL